MGLNRHAARAGLVAQLAHSFRLRADKGNARCGAGIHKIGVLGQKTIAGMDRIRAACLGHAQNFLNAQIGGHWP